MQGCKMGQCHGWMMPATRKASFMPFVLLLLVYCRCAKGSSFGGGLAGLTASDMREFLQVTNYTIEAPRKVTTHYYPIQNRECSFTISYPTMGYFGDMTAPPRIARTRAKIEGFAEGAGCVTEGEEGSVGDLSEGLQIVVLVLSPPLRAYSVIRCHHDVSITACIIWPYVKSCISLSSLVLRI